MTARRAITEDARSAAAFARKFGFVEYWRAKGWPEFCHPTTGDDFECS